MRTDILQELERIVRLAGNLVREAHDIEQSLRKRPAPPTLSPSTMWRCRAF